MYCHGDERKNVCFQSRWENEISIYLVTYLPKGKTKCSKSEWFYLTKRKKQVKRLT